MRIDRGDTTINSADIAGRISSLEDLQGWEIVRLRTGEVLRGDFDDEDDAKRYIDAEDYNPERVIARITELDDGDAKELSNLRALSDEIESTISSPSWTLYNDDFFTEEWAQEQAENELRISARRWPLNCVDWEVAAVRQRDDLFGNMVDFDGQSFYFSG